MSSLAIGTYPRFITHYFRSTTNFTRHIKISDPDKTLYSHIGDPEPSYLSRMTRVPGLSIMESIASEYGLMGLAAMGMGDRMNKTHSNSNMMRTQTLESIASTVDDLRGDPHSLQLDYKELRKGKTLMELPLLVDRRYLQPDDRLSSNDRFIKEEESLILCNTLAMKDVILDYQIWVKVDPEIQEGLYRWLKDLVMKGPSILSMEGWIFFCFFLIFGVWLFFGSFTIYPIFIVLFFFCVLFVLFLSVFVLK